MKAMWMGAALLAAMMAGGCAATGTNFGLPGSLLTGPTYTDGATATTDLKARNLSYLKAAQGAANGTQYFDIPAILAGTLGIASVSFEGVTEDLRPTAGTLAAGALGLRSYYNTGSRYGAYVGGARATSCLLGIATGLKDTLTATDVGYWASVSKVASANPGSPDYAAAKAMASAVTSAPDKLAAAAVRVDTEVMRKLKAPSAPDLSTYMRNYQIAAQRSETENQLLNSGGQRMGVKAALGADALTLKLAATTPDPQLFEALKDLDARIEQCVAFAV